VALGNTGNAEGSAMSIEISCAFATELATPEHIAVAEQLGYRNAWCYDSPAVYPDVWMILTRAAERTERIGLGPGVLIPSLRSPMVTAAAVLTLAAQAPGRVHVGIGSGFTGRVAMGQRPMRWADVSRYIEVLRALLRGDTAEWDGAAIALLHPERCGVRRPIEVPLVIGADGPRGLAVAETLGDGVFSANPAFLAGAAQQRRILLMWGTVLGPDEDVATQRVQVAIGPAAAVLYHVTYDRGGSAVDALPGGRAWREAIEKTPERQRHLAVHASHQIELNAADKVVAPAAEQVGAVRVLAVQRGCLPWRSLIQPQRSETSGRLRTWILAGIPTRSPTACAGGTGGRGPRTPRPLHPGSTSWTHARILATSRWPRAALRSR
jgi:5,10-methylenetetrahydromethanopterin reductase